jgi:hypothetical protein
MTIAPPLEPTAVQPIRTPPIETDRTARISFRQPVDPSGQIDAAWWPRSLDLTQELPELLDLLWTAGREITRVTYNIAAWQPAPRRMTVQNRTVRLGGFATSDPLTVRLSDSWGRERIDLLVVPPASEPVIAERALMLASVADSAFGANEILARATNPGANDSIEPR